MPFSRCPIGYKPHVIKLENTKSACIVVLPQFSLRPYFLSLELSVRLDLSKCLDLE
jgi:hypothetical protein